MRFDNNAHVHGPKTCSSSGAAGMAAILQSVVAAAARSSKRTFFHFPKGTGTANRNSVGADIDYPHSFLRQHLSPRTPIQFFRPENSLAAVSRSPLCRVASISPPTAPSPNSSGSLGFCWILTGLWTSARESHPRPPLALRHCACSPRAAGCLLPLKSGKTRDSRRLRNLSHGVLPLLGNFSPQSESQTAPH